jgi:hypothetical protein
VFWGRQSAQKALWCQNLPTHRLRLSLRPP